MVGYFIFSFQITRSLPASQREKLQTLFKMCDLEGTNRVLRKDLAELVRSLNQTAGVNISEAMQMRIFNEVLHNAGMRARSRFITKLAFSS